MTQNDHNAKVLYNILFSQDFIDWYESDFINHVTGELNCKSKEDIIQDISGYLKRYNKCPI